MYYVSYFHKKMCYIWNHSSNNIKQLQKYYIYLCYKYIDFFISLITQSQIHIETIMIILAKGFWISLVFLLGFFVINIEGKK